MSCYLKLFLPHLYTVRYIIVWESYKIVLIVFVDTRDGSVGVPTFGYDLINKRTKLFLLLVMPISAC